MEPILVSTCTGFLTSILAGSISSALGRHANRVLEQKEQSEEELSNAIQAHRSIQAELELACTKLAKQLAGVGNRDVTEPLRTLVMDQTFQSDLEQWLILGRITEGEEIDVRLREQLRRVAVASGVRNPDVTVEEDLGRLERMVFSSIVLSAWTQKRSMDHMRAKLEETQRLLRNVAGEYDKDERDRVTSLFVEGTLSEHDIIDLTGLPEDTSTATLRGLLRKLYMPLRLSMHSAIKTELAVTVEWMEKGRNERLDWEAGRKHERRDEGRTHPLGTVLGDDKRVVILGDPGAGKTTLLRWLATSMLLRRQGLDEFSVIPDTDTLPKEDYLPVLIRCREIADADRTRGFTDFLSAYLRKVMPDPKDGKVMQAVINEALADGQAILLVDGLDEIQDPIVRARFAREVDRIGVKFPKSPIVVTSRIVGYRDMPHRLGSDFRHGTIADLTDDDKRDFATRWIDATDSERTKHDRKRLAEELAKAFDANDRVRRMTGNAMLLTTLALIKRRVGKLPNQRHELYYEAVRVLLNFNPEHPAINESEAMPQLGYIAYEMCKRGEQQILESDLLALLDEIRLRFPNLRAVKKKEPAEFLELLEARSGIIMKVGDVRNESNEEDALWEFRHLTFQEYLAARAILKRQHPDSSQVLDLVSHIGVLVSQIERVRGRSEWAVPARWREALRLVVVETPSDDVDKVFEKILGGDNHILRQSHKRARAVFAALCLADEPDISDEVAEKVADEFVRSIQTNTNLLMESSDGSGRVSSTLDQAATELALSEWADLVRSLLLSFIRSEGRKANTKSELEETLPYCGVFCLLRENRSSVNEERVSELVSNVSSCDLNRSLDAILQLGQLIYEDNGIDYASVYNKLATTLTKTTEQQVKMCAAWAIGRFYQRYRNTFRGFRAGESVYTQMQIESLCNAIFQCNRPSSPEYACVPHLIAGLMRDTSDAVFNEVVHLANESNRQIFDMHLGQYIHLAMQSVRGERLCIMMKHPAEWVRRDAYDMVKPNLDHEPLGHVLRRNAENKESGLTRDRLYFALFRIGDPLGRSVVQRIAVDPNGISRNDAVESLAFSIDPKNRKLLSVDLDGVGPWLDPVQAVPRVHFQIYARRNKISEQDARILFASICEEIGVDYDF